MKKLTQSDKAIHDQFSRYGKNAREWMRKCELMLPMIERKRIWEKKGYDSIYEYARVIAGMSRYKVTDSLRIIKKVEDKPEIMKVAEKKGLNAVRPVAGIVTRETDGFWAKRAGEMSKHTLATFVKDYKNENEIELKKVSTCEQTGGPGTKFEAGEDMDKPNHAKKISIYMNLDPQIFEQLKKIKGNGDWNEVMGKLLDLSREGLEQGEFRLIEEKEKAEVMEEKRLRELEAEKPEIIQSKNHTPPMKIKKYIKNRSQGICEHANCDKPAEHFHHTEPFSINKIHDPDKILHVCKEHHKIIHYGYINDSEIKIGAIVERMGKNKSGWNQIEQLPLYDIKNMINHNVAEFTDR